MDETLRNEVRQLAALNYTPRQIAEIKGLDPADTEAWMKDESTDFYKCYKAGWYETDIAMRNAIRTLALAGSGPAQAMYQTIIDKAESRAFYG